MKSQQKKVLSLLLIILASACLCGTALAQAPECYVCTNSDIRGAETVCAEDENQGDPSASPSFNIESVDVMLQKGELKLYNADNEAIAQIDVAGEGDTSGTVVMPDRTGGAGRITYQKASTQLLRKTEIGDKEFMLVPIRVEFSDANSEDANIVFDAYIDQENILNFEELALAYQDWQQALSPETPDPQYLEISTKLSEIGEELQDISDGTQTLSFSMEQLIQGSKLELYQLIGIGASVLLIIVLLVLWLVYVKINRRRLQTLLDMSEEQDRTNQKTSAAVGDIDNHLKEAINETNKRLDFITLKTPPPPPPLIDPMKEFLGRVNGITAVNTPDQWCQSLTEYKPEFLKYDAIQRWFAREGGIGDPLFAVCSITSSNDSQLCLIPSCYDTKLASGDLLVAYDVMKPINGENIRTYKIDRAAILEPYGGYFRIVSRGQITLLP